MAQQVIDVLNGPFGKASPLSDPDSGEHYRVVMSDGWCGRRRNSRMDAHGWADLRKHDEQGPCGVVRVIPRESNR